jgi:O-antigen/teichoic acid export membrane protein
MSASAEKPTASLFRVARNAASLLTSDVLNKATTFVVYALVARYADARAFGQLSLGLLLLYTFQVFACSGLPTLMTRDLARRPRRTTKYFMAGSMVAGCAAFAATLAMALFASAMGYESDTRLVLMILAISLPLQAFSAATEAIFRAWERMHYIAFANVPANVLKMVGALVLLRAGYGVAAIAALVVGCRAAVLLAEWALVVPLIDRREVRVDLNYVKRLAKGGATFLGIDGLIALWGSLDAVLISKMCGESDVGLYSAAWQLLVPAGLVFQSLVSSVFPMMCQKAPSDSPRLKEMVCWLVEFLCLIGCPLAVGLYFLAEPCLVLLYGDAEFRASADMVRVLLAVLVLQTLTSALGHALWARLQERVTLRIVAVNAIVNLIAGVILIDRFGVLGAAIASLAAWIVNAVQHHRACTRAIVRIPILATTWKAAIASLAMASCFVALRGAGPVAAAISAAVAYVAVAGTLMIMSAGGLKELRAGYFAPLLE